MTFSPYDYKVGNKFSSRRSRKMFNNMDNAETLLSLPIELVIQIAKELSPNSLRRLSNSCRALSDILAAHSKSLPSDEQSILLIVDSSGDIKLRSTVEWSKGSLTKSSTVNCGRVLLNGRIVFDGDYLQRIVAITQFRTFKTIELHKFTINAANLCNLKHILMPFEQIILEKCFVSELLDFKMDAIDYSDCDYSKAISIPPSISTLVVMNSLDKPLPSRKSCNKILTNLLEMESFVSVASNVVMVRQLNTLHMLRKRSRKMTDLSFALGDNLVYYAAGLAEKNSFFCCPMFGKSLGSPVSSVGVRKYIKRLQTMPAVSDEQFALFCLRSSNFYRGHLLEPSFEVAMHLPREQLVTGIQEYELFLFERLDDFDVVARTYVCGGSGVYVQVDVFFAKKGTPEETLRNMVPL